MGSAAEILFFPIKHGVDIAKVLSEPSQALLVQPGFRAVYHGPLVKDSKVHCLVFEWESRAALEVYLKVYDRETATKVRGMMIDTEAGFEPFISDTGLVHLRRGSSVALTSKVTSFGFFAIRDANATESILDDVITNTTGTTEDLGTAQVGDAQGHATGYIWSLNQDMASPGHTLCIMELAGYESIEDYQSWLSSSDYAGKAGAKQPRLKDVGLTPVDILGKRRATIPGSGILHASLEKIAER